MNIVKNIAQILRNIASSLDKRHYSKIGVFVAAFTSNEEVLLVLPNYPDKFGKIRWSLPGGMFDSTDINDEYSTILMNAARREFREETMLNITCINFPHVSYSPDANDIRVIFPAELRRTDANTVRMLEQNLPNLHNSFKDGFHEIKKMGLFSINKLPPYPTEISKVQVDLIVNAHASWVRSKNHVNS